MLVTNPSIRKRIIDLIPYAEMCSVFSALVKDVAMEHRLTYEEALRRTTDALIQGTSCYFESRLAATKSAILPDRVMIHCPKCGKYGSVERMPDDSKDLKCVESECSECL